MAVPSMTCEIEFTAGVWTDVSAYVDWSAGGSTRFGRSSRYGTIQPGALNLTLANDDGRFTPARQVLSDGVTAHPYWPNVVPRKRIRVAYVIAGTPYYRFTGFIKGWPPAMLNGDIPRVAIAATTVDDRLSRVVLAPALQAAILSGNPVLFWPLTDPAGSTSGYEAISGLSPVGMSGSGPAVTFGVDGPGSGEGTAAAFAPASATSGKYLVPNKGSWPSTVGWSIEFWFKCSGVSPYGGDSEILHAGPWQAQLRVATGKLNIGAATTAAAVTDGAWHQVVATPGQIYVDGAAFSAGLGVPSQLLFGFDGGFLVDKFTGSLARIALYPITLSASAVAARFTAGRAGLGETVDQRIARMLGYGGLLASDYNLDASTVTLSAYEQGGKDIITACQDAVASEGGGAALYVGPDGKVQFRSRLFRKPGAPVITLDAEADLDGASFQPAFDDSQIVNQVQGSRATGSGTASTLTALDAPSRDTYGLASSSFTSYAQSDADVLYNAQDQVAQQRRPGYQIPQVPLDLATATSAGLYVAVAGVDIGDRARLTNLPAGAAPISQIDVYVEGWADSFATDQFTTVFDASPADSPPWALWDDATYGRWQSSGGLFLRDAITNAGTTLVIPNSRTNLCTNPSFEDGTTTGWTPSAGVLINAVDPAATQAGRGISGAWVMDLNLSPAPGGNVSFSFAATAGTVYTVSAYVWVETGGGAIVSSGILNISNGGTLSGSTGGLLGQWVRISQTFTATATAATTVQIKSTVAGAGIQEFLVDAVLIEAAPALYGYIEGTVTDTAFSTSAGSYPLTINVGNEHIRLNAAPAGSPQTFTGVTRGVDNTLAAAQPAGSLVDVVQPATWTL